MPRARITAIILSVATAWLGTALVSRAQDSFVQRLLQQQVYDPTMNDGDGEEDEYAVDQAAMWLQQPAA